MVIDMATYMSRTKYMREQLAKKETVIDLLYKQNLELAYEIQRLHHELDVLHQRQSENKS
jgi:hypothetical protein